MKNKEGKSREYLNTALRAGEDKLLHNPSRGEQVLCWATVLVALMSLVLSVITAIQGGDAMTIVRAFTEKVIWFIMIALLTVYDRILVVRGRSLAVIVFSLMSVARDVFGVVNASGFMMAVAVLSLIAGAAFYGTLFIDQFNPSDSKLKYWLIYGGALLKLIIILATIIAGGNKLAAAGTAEVLSVMSRGFCEILVMILMICHFDGFGYFGHVVDEVVSQRDVAACASDYMADHHEPVAHHNNMPSDKRPAETDEAEYVPFDDDETEKRTDIAEKVHNTEVDSRDSADDAAEQPSDEVLDDFGYVPYDDNTDTSVDSSVRPITTAGDNASQQLADDDADEQITVVEEDGVLVDDSVLELERTAATVASADAKGQTADNSPKMQADGEEASDDDKSVASDGADNISDDDADESAAVSTRRLWESLTPIERKYVSFGLAHHKPEETLQVRGLSGDLFDVWVDDETICFQNDLDQASGGRGVRTAAIPFDAVQGIGIGRIGNDECIVLTYLRDNEQIEIGFTKDSFGNFKRVMLACDK